MSAPQWKPGDVGAIDTRPAGDRRVMFTGSSWVSALGASLNRYLEPRPLVVIDPKDIPVAGGVLAPIWLRSLARDLRDDDRSESSSLENVLTFLAEAIDATNQPPRPEEPQGLGAVVEDDRGRQWIRVDWVNPWCIAKPHRRERHQRPTDDADHASHVKWPEVRAVRVLSEGWRA